MEKTEMSDARETHSPSDCKGHDGRGSGKAALREEITWTNLGSIFVWREPPSLLKGTQPGNII